MFEQPVKYLQPSNIHSSFLSQKIEPEELIKCALAVRKAEIQIYITLLSEHNITVKELAEKIGKSRPATQRLLQDLVSKNLAIREESLIGRGGYEYRYRAVPPEKVKEFIELTIDRWYQQVKSNLLHLSQDLYKKSK